MPVPPVVALRKRVAERASKPRRRMTASAEPGTRNARRYRWISVGLVDVVIVAFAVLTGALTGIWTFTVSGLLLALVTVTTLWLSESDVRLARARARAHERAAGAHRRETRVLIEHRARAVKLIRQVDPKMAADLDAALSLDLLRLHAMGTRLESDSDLG